MIYFVQSGLFGAQYNNQHLISQHLRCNLTEMMSPPIDEQDGELTKLYFVQFGLFGAQ